MPAYFADQIIAGKLDYKTLFSIKFWQKYQDDTDAILIASGRQDLIVRS